MSQLDHSKLDAYTALGMIRWQARCQGLFQGPIGFSAAAAWIDIGYLSVGTAAEAAARVEAAIEKHPILSGLADKIRTAVATLIAGHEIEYICPRYDPQNLLQTLENINLCDLTQDPETPVLPQSWIQTFIKLGIIRNLDYKSTPINNVWCHTLDFEYYYPVDDGFTFAGHQITGKNQAYVDFRLLDFLTQQSVYSPSILALTRLSYEGKISDLHLARDGTTVSLSFTQGEKHYVRSCRVENDLDEAPPLHLYDEILKLARPVHHPTAKIGIYRNMRVVADYKVWQDQQGCYAEYWIDDIRYAHHSTRDASSLLLEVVEAVDEILAPEIVELADLMRADIIQNFEVLDLLAGNYKFDYRGQEHVIKEMSYSKLCQYLGARASEICDSSSDISDPDPDLLELIFEDQQSEPPNIFYEVLPMQPKLEGVYEISSIIGMHPEKDGSFWELISHAGPDKSKVVLRKIFQVRDLQHNPWVIIASEFRQQRKPDKQYLVISKDKELINPAVSFYLHLVQK